MYTALFWKEYRQIRWFVATLFVCYIIMPCLIGLKVPEIFLGLWAIVTVSMLLFSSLMLGAEAFAGENKSNTMESLINLPITKSNIWMVKILFRTGALFLILSLAWLILVAIFQVSIPFIAFCYLAMFAIFVFFLGFFFSTIMPGSIHASITAIIVFASVVLIFWPLENHWQAFYLVCLILTLLSIPCSFISFYKKHDLK